MPLISCLQSSRGLWFWHRLVSITPLSDGGACSLRPHLSSTWCIPWCQYVLTESANITLPSFLRWYLKEQWPVNKVMTINFFDYLNNLRFFYRCPTVSNEPLCGFCNKRIMSPWKTCSTINVFCAFLILYDSLSNTTLAYTPCKKIIFKQCILQLIKNSALSCESPVRIQKTTVFGGIFTANFRKLGCC